MKLYIIYIFFDIHGREDDVFGEETCEGSSGGLQEGSEEGQGQQSMPGRGKGLSMFII